MSDRRRALLALTLGGVLFGLSVPLTKVALGWLDPAWLAFVRFALAAPVLALAAPRALRAACSWPIVLWGAIGYGAMVLLQNVGVERTSVGHAALLFGAIPAMVALMAFAAGRGSTRPLAWAGFAVALGGVVLVAGSGGAASVSGDLLVLASAFCAAAFLVAQERLLDGRDPVAVTAVQMAAGAAVAVPFAAVSGLPPATAGGGAVLAVGALVVAGTLLPFVLFAFGQARVPADLAGVFVNLEPLVGATVAVLVFGDAFGPLQAAGAVAILAGIGLSTAPAPARVASGACPASP